MPSDTPRALHTHADRLALFAVSRDRASRAAGSRRRSARSSVPSTSNRSAAATAAQQLCTTGCEIVHRLLDRRQLLVVGADRSSRRSPRRSRRRPASRAALVTASASRRTRRARSRAAREASGDPRAQLGLDPLDDLLRARAGREDPRDADRGELGQSSLGHDAAAEHDDVAGAARRERIDAPPETASCARPT